MKRTIPPRTSYAYIITPTQNPELFEEQEPNELTHPHVGVQPARDAKQQPAMRLLARRLRRQRRFG